MFGLPMTSTERHAHRRRRRIVAAALVTTALTACAQDPPKPKPLTAGSLDDRDFTRLRAAQARPHTVTPKPRRRTTRKKQATTWHWLPGDPTADDFRILRWCESGRDHSAGVDSPERARGFYKFMRGTWASVGGHGDPAAASYAEQTMRAILLYRREGWTPWLASASCTGLR